MSGFSGTPAGEEAASPQVTAVIPLYNKRDTIVRAIDSARAQSFRDIEIIVVDDGATDGSAEIVADRFAGEVRLLRQRNGGPGLARNTGAAAARAPLLAFLDADDAWRPDHIAAAVEMLRRAPDSVAYACGYDAGAYRRERPNKVAGLLERPVCRPLNPKVDGPTFKLHVDAMHSSCMVVRSAVFDRLGGFYAAERCLYGEDSWLWTAVLMEGPVCWDPAERVAFHVEDSDLGYAKGRHTPTPPLLTRTDALRERCPDAYRASFEAFVDLLLRIKFGDLFERGALSEIARLRAAHGQHTPMRRLRDAAYLARLKLRRALR